MNNTSLPLVSVIIPTYKRSDRLSRTINSVLEQTYPNVEIIVVDDNGFGTESQIQTEDRLKEYIKENKIIYIKHDVNKNGSAARNTGLKASHGYYINFLDDDDVMLPSKLREQVSCLINNPSYGATYCNIEMVVNSSFTLSGIKRIKTHNSKNGHILKDFLTEKCKFNTSSLLFKRSVLEKINGFDESWRRHQDYELMVRFFRENSVLCTSNYPLMIYDLTSERINNPNCVATFELEERFLTTFENDLKDCDAYADVAHVLWYKCLLDALKTNNTLYAKAAYKKLRGTSHLTLKEIVRLIIAYFLKK